MPRRMLRPEAFLKSLAAGSLAPGYLLCGPESLLRDEGIRALRARLASPGDAEGAGVDVDRFQAGEGPLSAVAAALATVGLFSGRRLVILSDLERAGRAAAAERDALVRVVGAGSVEGAVLVVTSDLSWKELERRSEVARKLAEHCPVVEVWHPREEDARRWIAAEARRRSLGLTPAACSLLVNRIGSDLQELSRELEKLELQAEPGRVLDEADVREGLRRGGQASVWDLCDSVVAGASRESLRAWVALEAEEPVLRVQWQLQRKAREAAAAAVPGAVGARLASLVLGSYALERAIKSGRVRSREENVAFSLLIAEAGTSARGRARQN